MMMTLKLFFSLMLKMHSTILIERHYCIIKNSCVHPSFSISSPHTYQKPVKMVIADSTKHDYIFSNEGCSQDGVHAMALYALGIRPLIDNLGEVVDHERCVSSHGVWMTVQRGDN